MKRSKKIVRFEYLDIDEHDIETAGIEDRKWNTDYTTSDYPAAYRLMDIYDIAVTLRRTHDYGAFFVYEIEGDTRYIFVREVS